jgi:protein phosphatase-4 regulatory subunit 3
MKELLKHIVQNHRDKLRSLAYMETFRQMIDRYDETQGFTQNPEALVETEAR